MEITSLPFWLIYTLHHLQVASVALLCITSCLIAFLSILYTMTDDDRCFNMEFGIAYDKFYRKNIVRLGIFFFILVGLAAFLPKESEYKTFITLKVGDEVAHSEIGEKSKDVIIKWLDEKYEDLTREKNHNDKEN